MVPIVIGLGSNLQDRYAYLRAGLDLLTRFMHVEVVSSFYQTKPMYVEDQPPFLNAVAKGHTDLGPIALVRALKSAERRVGRQQRERFGPRELDLDLLLYGNLNLQSSGVGEQWIQVPHPRTPERAFVLLPWMEIDPEAALPGFGALNRLLASTEFPVEDVVKVTDATF